MDHHLLILATVEAGGILFHGLLQIAHRVFLVLGQQGALGLVQRRPEAVLRHGGAENLVHVEETALGVGVAHLFEPLVDVLVGGEVPGHQKGVEDAEYTQNYGQRKRVYAQIDGRSADTGHAYAGMSISKYLEYLLFKLFIMQIKYI